jgi:prolyl-tRNA editing enzyme YbaK/EbsC (Cys-tRNA(Pro) deacylase)
VNDLVSAGMQRVADAAARKGVTLDFRLMRASTLTDEELAVTLGVEFGQIVRCVVCVAPRPGGRVIPVACLVSGRNRLDLDLLSAVTGEPAIRETTSQEAQALFGYPARGVPPFGHAHDVRTVMDQSLGHYEWLWAPAGADSAFLKIAPGTLAMLSNAVVAPVAQASWMRPSENRPIGGSPTGGRIRRFHGTRRPRTGEAQS